MQVLNLLDLLWNGLIFDRVCEPQSHNQNFALSSTITHFRHLLTVMGCSLVHHKPNQLVSPGLKLQDQSFFLIPPWHMLHPAGWAQFALFVDTRLSQP